MVSAPALDDIRLENNHPNITYFLSNGTIAVCDSVLSVIASGGSAAVLSNRTAWCLLAKQHTPTFPFTVCFS
jgi:hypothetical protein